MCGATLVSDSPVDNNRMPQLMSVPMAAGMTASPSVATMEPTGAIDPGDTPNVSLRQQMVRCGKAGCTKCPHGPYWYAYWTEDGRRRSRYIGRLLDE